MEKEILPTAVSFGQDTKVILCGYVVRKQKINGLPVGETSAFERGKWRSRRYDARQFNQNGFLWIRNARPGG
jgi:hypothetical protein